MSFDSTVHAKAVDLTRLTYEMTTAAGSGHPTSGASLAHLVTVLMYQHMRYEPANPMHPSSDRLILSEGHAVPIVYAACCDRGVAVAKELPRLSGRPVASVDDLRPLTREDAATLRELNSVIDGHPNPIEGFPFFDSATGSLGQGLSTAAGLALADRLDGVGKRFFCLIGDGESREGQVWEAVDFIADHALVAVCPIFNCNAFAQSNPAAAQQSPEATAAKLRAVGFDVQEIDGHNPTQIRVALDHHSAQADKAMQAGGGQAPVAPVAIVARTVKGWGTPSQQGNGHHGSAVKADRLPGVLKELDDTARSLGAAADMALKTPLLPTNKPPAPMVSEPPKFSEALQRFGMGDALEQGAMATRKAYGVAVRALGHARSDVFALDADVQGSTHAAMFAEDEAINRRFVECRIAEQNMVSAAVGLAAGRKVPFVSTFGKFLTRAYDQIEMGVNSGANFKLVGSHAGISLGADGPSQMAMADMGWFRGFTTMRFHDAGPADAAAADAQGVGEAEGDRAADAGTPGFYLLQPADAYACYALTRKMAEHRGPCYMRVHRPDAEFLYADDTEFELGGHEVLVDGSDLLIVAAGYMVHQANKALDELDKLNIDATLVDLYSIPFDGEAILDLANENNGVILTLEDNYGGGIGSAIADLVAADGGGFTVEQMHVTRLPKSAKSGEAMLEAAGLGPAAIARRASRLLDTAAV